MVNPVDESPLSFVFHSLVLALLADVFLNEVADVMGVRVRHAADVLLCVAMFVKCPLFKGAEFTQGLQLHLLMCLGCKWG
jgi:hypothetical protein